MSDGVARVVVGLLTGGQSTRMGKDKAATRVGAQTMAQRVAAACTSAGVETVVLGPDDGGTGLVHLVDDPDVPAGPLGGLITLLRARPGHAVLLVATDQPFLRPETLRELTSGFPTADIVVPIDQDQPQVTCARYGPAVLTEYERASLTDEPPSRLRALLDRVTTVRVQPDVWRNWGEDGRSFRSLDRPDDIDAAVADYEARPDGAAPLS